MDRLDSDTWCDECGEIGWEGTCDACLRFAAEQEERAAEGPGVWSARPAIRVRGRRAG
ncbi:MAG TPA: hypothetical protein VFG74_08785 [Miltoncostaeaceae bacterium]|nr:hypothetical protein [Miltoncostaeaceae bacterium]